MTAKEEIIAKLGISNDDFLTALKERMTRNKTSANGEVVAWHKELFSGEKPQQQETMKVEVEKTGTKGFFHKAKRKEAKLRLALTGASGSGKTFSALTLAQGLGGPIAVADTERGSAALYSDKFNFDTIEITPPYNLKKWLDVFEGATEASYNVLILDSITPLWSGEGGLLEQKDQLSKHGGKNSYTAWADVTPMYNRFVERMLNANIHVIATIRSKTEYSMETDGGRTIIKKVGLGPQFRDGIDYEFTTVFDIASDHSALVSKDRSGLFDAKTPFVISRETGTMIKKWLEGGQ